PKAKAIFHMAKRNATVTFALLVDRQIAEAFRPVRFERVPNKSKLVELLSPSLRQSLIVALLVYPSTEAKAIFHMAKRNATVTFAPLVDRQIAEAFRPIRFERVPNKSKLVELLSPSLRQSLIVALLSHPLTEAKAIFFVGSWYATVTFALLVDCQIAEAFPPVCFESVPNKSKLVQLLSAWCR